MRDAGWNTTQHLSGLGARAASIPLTRRPEITPCMRDRFIAQTTSVNCPERGLNGQLRRQRQASSRAASKPQSLRTAAASARRRSRPALAPACRRAWIPRFVPSSWAASARAAGGGGSLPARQRLGKEPSEQLVVSLRKADSQLPGGTPVDLGRTSCPRPAASGQPAVLRHQQLVLDETVEVKRCQGSGDPDRLGRLLAACPLKP